MLQRQKASPKSWWDEFPYYRNTFIEYARWYDDRQEIL